MIYVLTIIYGISWGGAYQKHVEFPNKESCFEALANMRVNDAGSNSNHETEKSIAFCAPLKKDERSK